MSEELPFYLRADGKKIFKKKDIERFKRDNPDIAHLVKYADFDYHTIEQDIFTSFCHWIIGQQLSVRVAESIIGRFITLVDPLTPQTSLKITDEKLRGCGLSNAKVRYIKNVAQFLIENKNHDMILYPDRFSSYELRKFYTQINGIGPWTVNMFLIFVLGKKNVFASGDLGVRKGIKIMYDLEHIPIERECKNYHWGEMSSVGTFLAWRLLEGQ